MFKLVENLERIVENSETTLKILLTAGASDLGIALTRYLASAGHQVFASVGTNQDAKLTRQIGGIPVYIDTTRDSEIASSLKMAKADVAINLDVQEFNAPPSVASRWSAEHVVSSTVGIVNAVEAVGTPYLIHVSPAFIYADSKAPVNEEGKLRRSGDHPLITAALKAEKAVKNASVKSTIIRAGYTYGANSPDMLNLRKAILAGKGLTSSDNLASWIYVDDLASAIALTVEQQPDNAVINVTDGNFVSPKHFLDDLADGMGISGAISKSMGILSMFTGKRVADDLVSLSSQASNDTAKEVLGWEPAYPAHADGVAQLLISWRSQLTV